MTNESGLKYYNQLKENLSEWDCELKDLNPSYEYPADEPSIPTASELELLIECCYKTLKQPLKTLGLSGISLVI